MNKYLFTLICCLILSFSVGCDTSQKGAGASSISYPLNASPLITDQTLGIDDPAGNWAINRFSYQSLFSLYLTQDWIPTGAIDTSGSSSNTSGPLVFTPTATLPSPVDGKTFIYTGAAGFLGNSILSYYDGTTPVYTVGFETLPTTTGQVPTFNSVTGKFDFTVPSGGSGVTEVATDPTVNDLIQGQSVVSQSSGDMFYRSITDRFYTLAGSAVVNHLVTISPVPADGNNIVSTDGFIDCGTGSDCSYLYALNAVPEFTANIGSGQQFDNWVGDATDTSTTTNPDTMTVDAAKTFGGAFSATVTDGEIGTTAFTGDDFNLSNQFVVYHDTASIQPTTVGTVRYAHVRVVDTDGFNVCVSLNLSSDNTVKLSGTGTLADNTAGWININCGADYTVLAATDYDIGIIAADGDVLMATNGTAGLGATSGWTDACAATKNTDNPALDTVSPMTIFFDNNPTVP